MAKVHRRLLARLGGGASAVLLDTPYGFQENADEITARAIEYFRENVGAEMTLASFRAADDDPLVRATAIARARAARYLFSGPGSPTYALRQWVGTEVPGIVADKLANGGIVTFASAASLTLGAHTVPVYEVYKVGDDPRWLPGLDILGPFGLSVAVIPHYDNAEGGTHDTRYCYLGERRLSALERQLPEGSFILGVDSHTALLLDLGAATAEVAGLGSATVRAAGRSRVFASGEVVPLAELAEAAARLRNATVTSEVTPTRPAATSPAADRDHIAPARRPLLDAAHESERRFGDALAGGAVRDAVRAVLELEGTLVSWSRDTVGTDEFERARAILQALIVQLGESSGEGRSDADERLEPLVELLVKLRAEARGRADYALADRIRDATTAAGIELRDTPDGTTWQRVDD
jgi:hypothetical protein